MDHVSNYRRKYYKLCGVSGLSNSSASRQEELNLALSKPTVQTADRLMTQLEHGTRTVRGLLTPDVPRYDPVPVLGKKIIIIHEALSTRKPQVN